MTKVQIASKAEQLRDDLAVMVNTCNKSEDYHLAQLAQGCLQQVAQLADRANTEAEQEKTDTAAATVTP